VSVTDLLRRALVRVQEPSIWRDDTRVELLGVLGVSLKNLQDTASAEKAFDQAVELAQRSLGGEHRQALHARVERLGVYRFQGRSQELRSEVQALLPLLRRHDADPADLVMTLQMKAHDAIDASRPDDAVQAATESLELAQRYLGPTHVDTANAATLVALGHEYAGRSAQAVQAAEFALALQLAAHAKEPGHGDVISARVGLARALGEAGDLKRCIAEFDALMPDAIERFGAGSVEVAFHRQNVVKYLLEAGEIERAEQAAADAERTFAAHPDLSPHFHPVARMTLAATWLAARRADAALPVFQAVSPRLLELLGPLHPQSVRAEENRALAEAALGRTDAASARLERLVEGLPAEKITSRLRRAQAVVQLRGGHAAEAVRLAQLAMKSIDGPRAELERMRVLPVLGMALLASGEARSADAALQEAIDSMDRHQTRASPERGDAVRALAQARSAGNGSVSPATPSPSSRR
jgi:tetratricopeptide (TPR) repeat protein